MAAASDQHRTVKADADWNGLGDRGSLTVMRLLLLSLVLIALAGEEPIAPGWEKTGVTARDDVVLEIWCKPGDANGRVVLRNRTDSEVRVGYRVSAEISTAHDYATVILPGAVMGLDKPIPVPIGTQVQPEFALTSVARLPISESSGYVRMDEDARDGVTAWIYRRVDGGDRAYLVLRNPGPAAVDVTLRLSGLEERESVRRERVPARTTRGEDGTLRVNYHPQAGSQVAVRVRIEAVAR